MRYARFMRSLIAVSFVLGLAALAGCDLVKTDKVIGKELEGLSCKVEARPLLAPELQNKRLIERKAGGFSIQVENSDPATGESLSMPISEPLKVGTFKIGTGAVLNTKAIKLADTPPGNARAFFSTEGTLVVTKLDATHAEGTFTFTANEGGAAPKKTFKVTDGYFNLHF